MIDSKRALHLYLALVVLYGLVIGWWVFFLSRQDDFLSKRMARSGAPLDPREIVALHDAVRDSMRMFAYEGTFLGIVLLASVYLVVRSQRRELLVHRQQRNFLSAVTHELKSPIASARLYLESLLLGRAEGEKRERYLRHAREDLDRLGQMVDHLLESARLSTAGPELAPEPLDLAAVAAETIETLGKEPASALLPVELEVSGKVPVRADRKALETILRNLLSNAAKYGGDEPRVHVSVSRSGSTAKLEVRDHGRGLQGVDAKRIFEPFVRGGDESVRTRPGVGLGLYLVAELARAQGGSVRAREAEPGGGLVVEVTLPALGSSQEEAS